MQPKRLVLMSMAVLGALCTLPVQAETFTFDHHDITFEPPKGYCALDAKQPGEQAIIETQKVLQAAYNEVVVVYADCADLDKARAGEMKRLENLGTFQIAKQNGRVSAVIGHSRTSYIEEVTKSAPQVDAKQIFSQVNDRSTNLGTGTIDSNKFGLLDSDRSAFYFGGVVTATLPDGSTLDKVSVNASTLINALPVAMSISRPAAGEDDLKALLAKQHENIAALIQANAATDATAVDPQQRRGFDWQQVLIAAVIGGLIGLVFILAKRAAKNRSTGPKA
jgi:hypothetical protein